MSERPQLKPTVTERMPPWLGALIALVVLIIVTVAWEYAQHGQSVFLKPENLINILRQWSVIGIISIGMTFVITSGGIDLSVGSLLAFAGGLGIWLMNTLVNAEMIVDAVQAAEEQGLTRMPYSGVREFLARLAMLVGVAGNEAFGVGVAVLTCLAAGVAAGWLNGVLVTRGRVAPFIVTLGGLAAYRSLALSLADGGEFRSASYAWFPIIGQGGVPIPGTNVAPHAPEPVPLLIPWPVVAFAVIALLAWVLLNRTRFGRYVTAIGANETAARYSAINVPRVKLLTYALIGLLTGLAALLLASRMNSISSSGTGVLYELDAIAAVVIGGTLMTGGYGTIAGTVVGVLILAVIGNMLHLLQVSPYLHGLVKGAIIVAAVLVQRKQP